MRLGVAFQTLGCKLNQLETDALVDSFKEAGASILPSGLAEGGSELDLFVLNTCTVTGKAEQKARRAARAVLARRPYAVVIATGCYAQLDPGGLEALGERIVAVPGDDKAAILGLSRWLAERWQGHGDLLDAVREWKAEPRSPGEGADRFAFHPESFAFHSRPALKVQDGCDNRCSYCRVCLARGSSRSLPLPEAVARARSLEASARAEAVLTGVNLSQYRDGGTGFPGLLAALLEGTENLAFRISSYEPDRVDEDFLSVFARERVRPHAHLPVQSGADPVLAKMGRGYRRDKVLRAVEALRRVKGDLFLAADIIAGFPGETDEDFAATLDFCRRADFAWIHAFPFSPRPGTRAYELKPRVPERVAGERVAELGELARSGRRAYAERWTGAEVEAVIEGGDVESDDGEEGAAAEGAHGSTSEGEDVEEARVPRLEETAPVRGSLRFGDASARFGEASTRLGDASPRLGDATMRLGTSANYLKLRIEEVPPGLRPGCAVRCRIIRALPFDETGFDALARLA
ncbi:MAG: MiaB/RimO family radical SAM methylthiotransferase [Treponema sp.]|nr:MiaB/RimO family radical SAM methylthiotransferase [Treponema sp.]